MRLVTLALRAVFTGSQRSPGVRAMSSVADLPVEVGGWCEW